MHVRWKLKTSLGRVTMHVPCHLYRTLEAMNVPWPCHDACALPSLSYVGSSERHLAVLRLHVTMAQGCYLYRTLKAMNAS
eukprot:6055771-Prymnesium_polylepis.2